VPGDREATAAVQDFTTGTAGGHGSRAGRILHALDGVNERELCNERCSLALRAVEGDRSAQRLDAVP
jgi:hypothetical protein